MRATISRRSIPIITLKIAKIEPIAANLIADVVVGVNVAVPGFFEAFALESGLYGAGVGAAVAVDEVVVVAFLEAAPLVRADFVASVCGDVRTALTRVDNFQVAILVATIVGKIVGVIATVVKFTCCRI